MAISARRTMIALATVAVLLTAAPVLVTQSTAQSASSSSSVGLQISVTDGKSTIHAGDSMIYVISLTQNTESSRRVNVDLYLPTFANIITPQNGGVVSGTRVRWNDIVILQGQTQQLSVNVSTDPNTPEGTDLIARAIAGDAEANDSTVIQSTPASGGTFMVNVTDEAQTVAPGGTLPYTVTVKNTAAFAQTADVILTASQFLTLDTITPPTTEDSNVLVWKNQSFTPGETKTYTFKGEVRRNAQEFVSVNTLVKVGTATAADSTSVQTSHGTSSRSSSSSSSSARSRSANRSVLFSKTPDTNEITPGGVVRYTLYVQNVLLTVIDDAVITDRFDASLLTVSDNAGGTVIGPGQIQWHLPSLQPGQTWQQTYSLAVSTALPTGTQLSNIATLSGNDVDSATLSEKVIVVKTGVVSQLPTTGAAFDILFVLATLPFAAAGVYMQRKSGA